jgi:mxaA protein
MINAARTPARPIATALAAALAVLGGMQAAHAELRVEAPRAFGYTVGDELEVVARAAGGEPLAGSLPKPGRVSRDLALRAVAVEGDAVRLRYQVIGAPESVALVEVPAWTLKLRGAGGIIEERVAAIPVSLSPLTPAEAIERDGLEALRPPLATPRADERGPQLRLALYAAVAGALTLTYLWTAWGRGWLLPRRAPFARARFELLRLRADDPEAGVQALRIVHRALDTRAGRVLMAPDLPAFLDARPRLVSIRPDLEALFRRSAAAFFGNAGAPPGDTLAFARELCAKAARLDP